MIEEERVAPSAIQAVTDIFLRASSDDPPFPPAELYSEGWMLRLVMDSHHHGQNTLPVPLVADSRWYSEARLVSPFQPSRRGDPLGEGITHADGVVGQFGIRSGTTAGFELTINRQFVVIEAKMGSRLAAGTTRVPWFDQAVRNVSAMAWAIQISGRPVSSFESLAFVVIAPRGHIASEPTFTKYMDRSSLIEKFGRRVELYQEETTRYQALNEFRENVFEPLVMQGDLVLWTWEDAIAGIEDAVLAASLTDFYSHCLRYAAPPSAGRSAPVI